MARYIDADKFAERIKVSPAFRNINDGFWLQRVVLDLLNNMPTADVAPKSEVAILTAQNMALEIAKNDLQHRLNTYIGVENILKDNMGELIKAAINGAKQEVAREIFEEIDKILNESRQGEYSKEFGFLNRVSYNGYVLGKGLAELKKKYTEGDK